MTEDEIRNLPAGDEMDARVAEDVMGWHRNENGGYPCWNDAEGRFQCGIPHTDWEDDEDFHLLRWHPSESILWAWEVVEKLERDNLCMTILNDGSCWSVFIYNEHKVTMAYANADTAPLAICRAALLTVSE